MKCRTGLWVKYRRWGNRFGALKKFLSIHPDRDVRTGASKGGENLRPNGNKVRETKKGLVFAFIYEGVANWSQVDGVVTLKQKKPDVIIRLDDYRNGMGMCAIALLENVKKQNVSIKKIAKYYKGHRERDRAFKWRLRWTAGS